MLIKNNLNQFHVHIGPCTYFGQV